MSYPTLLLRSIYTYTPSLEQKAQLVYRQLPSAYLTAFHPKHFQPLDHGPPHPLFSLTLLNPTTNLKLAKVAHMSRSHHRNIKNMEDQASICCPKPANLSVLCKCLLMKIIQMNSRLQKLKKNTNFLKELKKFKEDTKKQLNGIKDK